jgi:hypothetical protein
MLWIEGTYLVVVLGNGGEAFKYLIRLIGTAKSLELVAQLQTLETFIAASWSGCIQSEAACHLPLSADPQARLQEQLSRAALTRWLRKRVLV